MMNDAVAAVEGFDGAAEFVRIAAGDGHASALGKELTGGGQADAAAAAGD